jgi:hypothetical protein
MGKFLGGQKVGPTLISVLVVVGFVTVLVLMIVRPVALDATVADILKILIGTLAAKFGDVVQYHIGDTAASKEKTTMVRDLALQTPPPDADPKP